MNPSFSSRSLSFVHLDPGIELFKVLGGMQRLVDSIDGFLEVESGVDDVPFKVGFDIFERLEVVLDLIEVRKGGLKLVEFRSVPDEIRV